jgi:hypothetical protein
VDVIGNLRQALETAGPSPVRLGTEKVRGAMQVVAQQTPGFLRAGAGLDQASSPSEIFRMEDLG